MSLKQFGYYHISRTLSLFFKKYAWAYLIRIFQFRNKLFSLDSIQCDLKSIDVLISHKQ